MLIEVIKGNEIRNFDALSIAGKVAKHVESIAIYILFSEGFKIIS